MMKNIYVYILGGFAAVCLIAVLLITSVEAVCYWVSGYFEHEYEKHQVLEDVDMEMEDLLLVTDHMMAYLRGQQEDLQVAADIGGKTQPFFNQRELSHMEDVRGLFLGGLALRRICLCAAAVILFVIWKKGGLKLLPRAICIGTGVVFGGAALLALAAAVDFRRAFTLFHQIFFDNDLWLLNPKTDRLINIVPQGFFMDTALWIAVIFGLCMALLLGVSVLAQIRGRKGRRGERKNRRLQR